MGDYDENRHLEVHGGTDGGFRVRLRRHFGAVSSWSPSSSDRQAYQAWRDAILQGASDATIDALGVALWGQWWSQMGIAGTEGRAAAYDAVRHAAA